MEEKELKVLLTEKKFKELKKSLEIQAKCIQINIYYADTLGITEKDNINIRVRLVDGKILLQVKLPGKEEGILHIREEYEKELKVIPYIIKGKELFDIMSKKIPDVSMIGILITERYICNIKKGIVVCLDKNIYMNKVDYELEIEFEGNLKDESLKIFYDYNIPLDGDSIGKRKRFMREYNDNVNKNI